MSIREFFTGIPREAVRLCGIRQEPLESWIKDANGHDVPELGLNSLLMREAFLQLLATGLGALILVSAATVVASTKIKIKDFWYITVIGIIQTAKVVSFISGPTVRFLVQFPAVSIHHILISIRTRRGHDVGDVTEFVGLASLVPIVFAAAPMAIATSCYELSYFGLHGVHNYGDSDIDTRRGNIKPALIAFYSLVLAQGTVLLIWSSVSLARLSATQRVRRVYFGIGNTDGIELMDRYITDTQDKCMEKGVFSTNNRTLVSFAAELLQSEHPSDHVSAVSVLRVLTTREERAAGAVEQICSSEQIVGNLFKLLRPKSPLDLKTKAETAEILMKLACNLRLTDITGAAHSISSLLDPHPRLMRTAAQGHPEPPAPGVTPKLTCNEGCRRLFIGLKKCMGLRANEGGGEGEPSPPGETQTQTNNSNQGEAESQSIGETECPPGDTQAQTNNTNQDGAESQSRGETECPSGETQAQTNNTNQDGAESQSTGETECPAGETQAQTNNTNQDRVEPQSTGETECFCWLPIKLRFIRNREEIQVQINNTNEGGARDKRPLIVHGLMILDKLASDPGNCTEICKTTDLVPKILAPLTHGLLNTLRNDSTIQIVKASLRVVAKLTSGTCESSSKLRRELISENSKTARNIIWIMKNSSDEQEMRMLAVEILTRLTLGQPMELMNARAVDLRSWEVIWQEVGDHVPALVQLMNNADETSTEHRAVAAEFLALICAKSRTYRNRLDRLSSVSNSLPEVLKAIVTINITDMAERRKFLASFLGLAVQIHENLATADDFAKAVIRGCGLIQLAGKLREIIVEMKNEYEREDEMKNEMEGETCLVITKAAAKLVTWTISIGPVVYANYFLDIVEELNDIVKATGDLEWCLVLRGDANEMGPYETLQTLVENVTNLVQLPPLQQ